jgi:hypothetical protein
MMVSAAIAAVILTFLGFLHVYWAAGGTWGLTAIIPLDNGRPVLSVTPIPTAIVAIALLAQRIGWIAIPGVAPYTRLGLRLMYSVFLLRSIGEFRYCGFFKRVRDTRFAMFDTRFYSPLCLLLATLIMVAAE